MEEAIEPAEDMLIPEIGIRWLTPDTTRLHKPEVAMIHCEIDGKDIRGVYAVRMFPVRHPQRLHLGAILQ